MNAARNYVDFLLHTLRLDIMMRVFENVKGVELAVA
jgi:hypothetical protein